jgi:Common central domain of tyrosinase
MALGDGVRRNVSTISADERNRLRDAFLSLKHEHFYSDGVAYWDKQEDVHKNAHEAGQDVHVGPAFLPWHREICNRLEGLLRIVDPQLSLHYWDWTTDPRVATPGHAALLTSDFMGSSAGDAGHPFEDFDSTEDAEIHNGHTKVWRNLIAGQPIVASDHAIVSAGDGLSRDQQFPAMEAELHNAHDYIHSSYIRGTIGASHYSFHDPFVFLLHSNVDRLWACWQNAAGQAWRLDPTQTFGADGSAPSINDHLEPWSGGTGLIPWAPPENQQVVKTSKDPTIINPPLYDTCPVVFSSRFGEKWAAIVHILFGIINDAPGVVIGPDGKPHPVDPGWGRLLAHVNQLEPASRETLIGLAVAEIGKLAEGRVSRAEIQKTAVGVLSRAVADMRSAQIR